MVSIPRDMSSLMPKAQKITPLRLPMRILGPFKFSFVFDVCCGRCFASNAAMQLCLVSVANKQVMDNTLIVHQQKHELL